MSDQSLEALAIANRKRRAGAELKREIKAGRITIAAALEDPRAETLSIFQILSAQTRWGRRRTEKFLTDLRVASRVSRGMAERKVREVPEAVKQRVVDVYGQIYGYKPGGTKSSRA